MGGISWGGRRSLPKLVGRVNIALHVLDLLVTFVNDPPTKANDSRVRRPVLALCGRSLNSSLLPQSTFVWMHDVWIFGSWIVYYRTVVLQAAPRFRLAPPPTGPAGVGVAHCSALAAHPTAAGTRSMRSWVPMTAATRLRPCSALSPRAPWATPPPGSISIVIDNHARVAGQIARSFMACIGGVQF